MDVRQAFAGKNPIPWAAILKNTEGREAKLSRPSSHPLELSELLRGLFNGMYKRYAIYRATGVVLMACRKSGVGLIQNIGDCPGKSREGRSAHLSKNLSRACRMIPIHSQRVPDSGHSHGHDRIVMVDQHRSHKPL